MLKIEGRNACTYVAYHVTGARHSWPNKYINKSDRAIKCVATQK